MANGVGDSPDGPSVEEIEAALNRTGFLLEHQVAKKLRENRHKPEVTMADAYPDPESGKSREIDVRADFYRLIERESNIRIRLGISLIIECKSSIAPFVLIGDHGQESPQTNNLIAVSFDPFSLLFSKVMYDHNTLETNFNLSHLPGLPTKDDFTGYQLLRLSRQGGNWKADNSSIYDSILYPLAKAWKHRIALCQRYKVRAPRVVWEYPTIEYVFPIIVISGQLYVVDTTEDDLNIRLEKWAGIKRRFHSTELNDDFRVDVVPVNNLDDYLDAKILKLYAAAEDKIARNIHFFDPEWMIANLGEPAQREDFDQWLKSYKEQRKP